MKKIISFISFSLVFAFTFLLALSVVGGLALSVVEEAHAAPTAIDVTTLANYVGNTTTNTPGTDAGELATGDFNCDGEDDVIISAGGYSSGKGRIYAIWGGGAISGSTTLSSTTMDLTITGASASQGVGANIVVTDVNEDGCDDVISLDSSTYLTTFYGSSSWSGSYTNSSSIYANRVNLSSTSGEYYYLHLLGALEGDWDSDGDTDSADGFLAVCSSYEVQCYLLPVAEVLDTSGATIEELSSYWAEGTDIHEAITSGDIDNDGYADLIVGSSTNSSEDNVTIWFGPLSSSTSSYNDASTTPATYFVAGDVSGSGEDIMFGDTNATAGYGTAVFAEDIYAEDGYADLVFASTRETVDSNAYSGRMHLISGESIKDFRDNHTSTNGYVIWYTNGSTYDCSTSSTCDYDDVSHFYYTTGEANVYFGTGSQSSAFHGDLNGDGVKEFLMGAQLYDGANYYGRNYLVYGGAEDVNADTSEDVNLNTDDSAVYYMDGENYNDGLSATVAVADVTGDGLDDMMITADGYDGAEGKLYIYPGAATDLDADGYASAQDDGSGVYETYDCNDRDASVYPMTWYLDSDGDGEGSTSSSQVSCDQPVGYVSNSNDCDDSNASLYTSATEACDGVDNNCDGSADEGLATTTYYLDSDGDGYGSTSSPQATCSSTAPSGYVSDSTDCDDSLATSSPTGTETCGDSVDQNCDGSDLSCSSVDADGDSLSEDDGDCDDTNATIYPFATETCGDSIDQDCDGSDTTCPAVDADSDGSDATLDCNDSDATVYPGATEINDDGIDQDCDGSDAVTASTTTDADGDGYDTTTDCDDTNATVYPSALELGDGLDNDCDDRFDEGLLRGSITSVPTSVDAGASFDVEYELTNDTGIEDFRVEILINNYSNSSIYGTAASWGVPPSRAMYICTPSRCTTMDDSTVTLPIGATTTTTTTVIMPATVTSGETYTVRIRVTDDATGQYFTRDLDRVAIN